MMAILLLPYTIPNLSGSILHVSIIRLNQLLITGGGTPDWTTITFLAIVFVI
jgi:hypothetical protein